jgi:CheY-like chemotaxis protein
MQEEISILLVDDDPDDQEIFSFAMQEANAHAVCTFANDGVQAIEKFHTDDDFTPRLIFVDVNMPRMNGAQCLAEIRKMDRLKHIPVFMYSTSAEPEIMEQCIQLGATGFIQKYTDTHLLEKELQKILASIHFS